MASWSTKSRSVRILERLGGIELSSAYTCIKAISKKKHETIAAFREQFIVGAEEKGLSKLRHRIFLV